MLSGGLHVPGVLEESESQLRHQYGSVSLTDWELEAGIEEH